MNLMILSRNHRLFGLTIGSLLAFWTFFGALELAETMASGNQPVAEDQQEQDLDQAALAQLAHAVRSDAPSVDLSMTTSATADTIEAQTAHVSLLGSEKNCFAGLRTPPLRLHQLISVYRI